MTRTTDDAVTQPSAGFCARCGAPVPGEMPPGVPAGMCPKCVLNLALRSQTAASPSAPSRSGFVAPEPDTLAAHFPQLEIVELLGQGGMGAVYKARQPSLDRWVALKVLPPEAGRDPAFAERFTREARALARLSHASVVSVYDFGRAGELYYIIMEFVDGMNLRQTLREKALKPEEAIAIVPVLCDALQYAHDEGIVHRDIKPENILIDKRGRVKIADFGLAKLLGTDVQPESHLTMAGQVMGTPSYMAPEQIEKPQTVDHRADIYSLGVVFYEMLTGELPLGRFAPPSHCVQVDVRLDEVVLRTLEKEPQRRYQRAGELKTDVQHITTTAGEPPHAVAKAAGFIPAGYEYKSKRTLFGLPLLHIARGYDPATGKTRVAKGIFAMGDQAIGVVAVAGLAKGVIAIGGMAIGLFTIGGISLSLLAAFGGMAVSLGVAAGGFSAGTISMGGMALGWYAYGGGAWGMHALGGNANDPGAVAFFGDWAQHWLKRAIVALMAIPLLVLVLWLAAYIGLRGRGTHTGGPVA